MALHDFGLPDLLAGNAVQHGGRLAFVDGGRRFTHAQHRQRVERLARGLAGAGIVPGERVAVLAHNRVEQVELLGAAARLGAIVVPLNWRLRADEIEWILQDAAPRLVAVGPECAALLPPAASGRGPARYAFGPAAPPLASFDALYLDGDAPALPEAPGGAGLVILYTAAVGGRPRGALLSQRSLLAGAMQAAQAFGLSADDVNLGVLPLCHVTAIGLLLAAQWAGGATLLMPRFEPEALVRAIEAERGSLLGVFPPMLAALLDAADAQGAGLSSLRTLTGLEAPAVIERLRARVPDATFWATYGQTETAGSVTLGRHDERPGSAGRPLPLARIAMLDERGRPVPVGHTGEIAVRGPLVFEGYWGRPDETGFAHRGGWHHTGDRGRFDDDGWLWYVGRLPEKALIKPGGENVYPAEVEQVLLEHPAIAEAAVIGVPDAHWGEAVKAVCVRRAGATVAADALIAFVGERIAGYKKPRHVVFVDALPRGGDGAVDRAAIEREHGQG